jgi:hypothetical protein
MKRRAAVLLVCALTFVVAGCFRTVYRGEGLRFGASFNRPSASERLVYHFEEETWNHYFLFALVPTSKVDMEDVIGRHVSPGQEVRNLKIRHEATFLNGLIWVLVGGLYNPMTTTVTGDVVQVAGSP